MSDGKPAAAQWDWLKEPDVALELYNAERRAFYEWDAAAVEWSKATGRLDPEGGDLSKDDAEMLNALKERLDEAAKAYEIARSKLHDAWAA
jgi:hypothetical protein